MHPQVTNSGPCPFSKLLKREGAISQGLIQLAQVFGKFHCGLSNTNMVLTNQYLDTRLPYG